jgi:hypothetical protein
MSDVTLQRWARLRPEFHSRYPAAYQGKWYRVLEGHPDPSVTTLTGWVWLDMPGKVRNMWAGHLEIADREGT